MEKKFFTCFFLFANSVKKDTYKPIRAYYAISCEKVSRSKVLVYIKSSSTCYESSKMAISRSLHLLRHHSGIKHSAFFTFVLPLVAATFALSHAASGPLFARKSELQWKQYSDYLDGTKRGDFNKFKNQEIYSEIH